MNWYAFLADLVAASAVGGCVAMILFSAAWHKFSELDIFAGALDAYQFLPSVRQGQRPEPSRTALHRRERAGQELGVRGAGVQRARRAAKHRAALPRPRRLRERLRRDQEPVGLGWRTTSSAVRSARAPWRWSTTGGAGTCGWLIRRRGWRRSRAGPSGSARWDA